MVLPGLAPPGFNLRDGCCEKTAGSRESTHFEGLFDELFHGSLDAQPVKKWQPKTNLSGKAELGLLAALLLLASSVAGAVWFVVQNNKPSGSAAIHQPDEYETDTTPPASPTIRPVPPRPESRKPAVTIVSDPKAEAAITALRTIIPEDKEPRKAAKASETKVAAASAAQLDVDGQVVDWDSPEVRAAIGLLNSYRTGKSWREKLPLIHQPGQAQLLMEEFYGSQGLIDPALAGMISASNLKIGNRSVLAVSYTCGDRLNGIVHANFWRDPEGLRLDWESFVGFSGKGMGSFRVSRLTKPTVFRVLAVPDDYYNFEFADSKKYLSLRLYSPSGEDYLHGYCPRDSADGRKLVEILGESFDPTIATLGGNGMISPQRGLHFPITVELAFPENAQSDRCVKIEKFISPWWLALDVEKLTTASIEVEKPPADTTATVR